MSAVDGSFEGRTAIVAGASSGIGLATAKALHDRGATVHALARRQGVMEEGAGAERLATGRFHARTLDVSDQAATERVAGEITGAGSIDLIVFATGVNLPERRLEQLTGESWDQLVTTNLSGAFYLVGACLPALRRSRGIVILIGSVSGSWPDVSGPAYAASKAGMLAFARSAGLEEQEHGVRFSTVLPGIVDTPILENRPVPPDARIRAHALTPEDVAEACLYIARQPLRVSIPELTILPAALQTQGRTGVASPDVAEAFER